MKTIAAQLDSGVRAQLEEAARELVALRFYQRFLDEAVPRNARRKQQPRGAGWGPGRTMAEALFQIAEPGESRQARVGPARSGSISGRRTRWSRNRRRGQADGAGRRAEATRSSRRWFTTAVDGGVAVGADARDRLAAQFPRDAIASVGSASWDEAGATRRRRGS